MVVEKYGRIQIDFEPGVVADSVRYIAPDGTAETGPVFKDMPVKFEYDHHGYESVEQTGDIRLAARYTPLMAGEYHWEALYQGKAVAGGVFECVDSVNPGYVVVSPKDSRYFAYSNGDPYVPIGLNLVSCDYYALPAGGDHFERSHHRATPGSLTYERWMRELSENGGNYARLWLSSKYFEIRTETPGVHDLKAMARLDKVVEIARKYGIRLKMCFEHFRTFTNTSSFFYRKMRDPETGEEMTDIERWFNDPRWNEIWLKDIEPYINRYWNDPVVFSWELWNEIDCGDACFESVYGWTKRMLPEIKKRSPRNLVTNSLGSFDETWKQKVQDSFRDMEEMEFQQVHRYLDQGAPWDISTEDPVLFSVDAVVRSRREDKPVILTETGAVNDRHTGPFRFYLCDHKGLIFHDVTYPAFFAGAAGSGHIWHWGEYVEAKNLWKYYKPLKDVLEGVKVDQERFKTADYSSSDVWILALEGENHTLLFVRNKSDRWDYILRDGLEPQLITGLTITIDGAVNAEAYWFCGENPGSVSLNGDQLHFPDFYHGCVVRVARSKG
ncbi:MAG: hypothetical protein GX024_09110 [Clostridiales bacterium]|nr:hypothetical protein [Clostridiales bacterium]